MFSLSAAISQNLKPVNGQKQQQQPLQQQQQKQPQQQGRQVRADPISNLSSQSKKKQETQSHSLGRDRRG